VGLGVGVVGLGAFTVFGLMNNSKFDDIEKQCAGGSRCPDSLGSDAETGRSYQTFANVGLGVGVVGVATAVVLLISERGSATSEVSAETKTSSMELNLGIGSASVRGQF
jgi:hypothetical protein